MRNTRNKNAGVPDPRRLFVYNGGFLTQRQMRRIVTLAGYRLSLGLPGPGDLVGVWGQSPTAHRGEAIAAKRDLPLVRIEDAFLRSLHPGRAGEPPLGLMIDHSGIHFDPSRPSDLETLLASHPLDDTALLNRARVAIERMKAAHLSKYSGFDPVTPIPAPGYVLVIDQTKGDASVTASGADRNTFREMLYWARENHPGARIVIKTHPETAQGHRAGYFGPEDLTDGIEFLADPVSPWALMEGAIAVYAVSSQLGFEAILAGHKPHVFGQPFYAGWGLTHDHNPRPLPRRGRSLTRAQVFAAAMILYPKWYDPYRDKLCPLETVLDTLETQARAWREDHRGWVAGGMRLWKRKPLQKVFGREKRVRFTNDPDKARQMDRPMMVWSSKAEGWDGALRVEDGFLRSRGLGAELVPPLSLVLDDLGIYYDPSRASRLERLIAASTGLRDDELHRAERLRHRLIKDQVTKYNLGGDLPDLPDGHRILVPGQVEDDASILTGAGEVRTNLELLRRVRAENPDAVILYKPHPDVETGLRTGRIEAEGLADLVLDRADPAALLDQVQDVWTMTSGLGFEALLRGAKVTTLGVPFYAGWGLTRDLGPVPDRRTTQVSLDGLVHAALIAYPRYFDPVTRRACPVEVALERLSTGRIPHPGLANRLLAKAQGALASYAWIWR